MTPPRPSITLDVDLRNPGQFLACCGLLELAGRLDSEAVGWFEKSQFSLRCAQADDLWNLFVDSKPTAAFSSEKENRMKELKNKGKKKLSDPERRELATLESERRIAPIRLQIGTGLLIDWWFDPSINDAGFKTWGGPQVVIDIVRGLLDHLKGMRNVGPGTNCWMVKPISEPKPFYFDSRISRLTSLDLGFSADGFTTAFSPAVELLALIGMQRFRPGTLIERERYAFAAWKEPLPAAIAAAVAPGLIPTLIDRRYQFPLVVRTGGKYKAFGPATLERSLHV
jgi:CRISPR-associated protein Csb3